MAQGEIDIIEGVNRNSVNKFVLHTDTHCKVNGLGQTGTPEMSDCAFDTNGATGCGVSDKRTNSFGTDFNANKGGYYVTEWQTEGIKIWFFPRGSAPKSLTTSEPDTSEFGTPAASFQGDCDVGKRFLDQRFIFTNTFCGDWGGNVYAQSGCPMYPGLDGMASCKKYVAEHPEVFEDAYWRVSSFKTYNKRTISSSSSVAPSSASRASSSSVKTSSSSVHSSSSLASSSSIHASSSAASSSSALSSSDVHSSTAPTHTVSSSVYPSSTPAASSSIIGSSSSSSYDVSSSTEHISSSIASASASETPYPYDISSSSASEVSSIYPSATTAVSSSTPYSSGVSSSADYSSAISSSAYPDVTSSSVVDDKSSSSSSVHSTSAPEYSVYPEGEGHGYGSVSSKTPDASSKTSDYPVSSSKTLEYDSYPVASSSASVSGSEYPTSTPAYDEYPELPSFTPLYSTYPSVSSKASGGDHKSTDSHKTTTVYKTTYVDVCPTGYTTVTTKVTAIQTPAPYPTAGGHYAPPGFEVTTKYCAQGCGEGPKTVTVTVPCSKCQATTSLPNKPTDVPNKPTGDKPYVPTESSKPSIPEDSKTKTTATRIITLTTVPVPEGTYPATQSSASPSAKHPDSDLEKGYDNNKPNAPSAKYPNSDSEKGNGNDKPNVPIGSAPAPKPVAPTGSVGSDMPVYPTGGQPASPSGGKPVYPSVGYPGSNVTASYGTATSAYSKPSQTGYKTPEFTGAASRMRIGGVVAGAAGAFAALMM